VKARWLDNDLSNTYKRDKKEKKVRSQIEIYNYLYQKNAKHNETATMQLPESIDRSLATL
jgi:polyphosphate kinase